MRCQNAGTDPFLCLVVACVCAWFVSKGPGYGRVRGRVRCGTKTQSEPICQSWSLLLQCICVGVFCICVSMCARICVSVRFHMYALFCIYTSNFISKSAKLSHAQALITRVCDVRAPQASCPPCRTCGRSVVTQYDSNLASLSLYTHAPSNQGALKEKHMFMACSCWQVLDQTDNLGTDPDEDWSGLSLQEVALALKQRVKRMQQSARTPVTRVRGRRKLWADVGKETAVCDSVVFV